MRYTTPHGVRDHAEHEKKDNSKAHINQAYVALTLSIFLHLPISCAYQ